MTALVITLGILGLLVTFGCYVSWCVKDYYDEVRKKREGKK